jgi:transcription-repair coupling factor (superfamily II helicase)
VLGDNQSGNMMEVGFQLYNEMLGEAVRSLKSGKRARPVVELGLFGSNTEINLHAPALLPDAYCGDVHVRLSLYKRLATADAPRQDRHHAGRDRGPLWQAAATSAGAVRHAQAARAGQAYGVHQDRCRPGIINITFRSNPPVEPLRIIELVQKNKQIKLAGNDKLRIEREISAPADRAHYLRDLLRALGQPLKNDA